MTKYDVINEIMADIKPVLSEKDAIYVKNVLIVKLRDFVYQEPKNELSTEVKDNDWILQRFAIDSLAQGRKESTIKQYLFIVRQFLDYNNLHYTQVKGQDIIDYLAIRQYKDGISQSYKATLMKYLRVFFKWAYKKHHITDDVMLDVDTVKAPQKPKAKLSDDEVEKCRINLENAKYRAFFELMLSTGMRVGEIQNVKIEDFNLAENSVKIWGEKTSEYRKGNITPSCKIALLQIIGNRQSGYLFENKMHHHLNKSTLQKWTKKICAKGEVNKYVSVHVFRKTFASTTYRKTGDVYLVSRMLGHSDISTTAKFYIKEETDDMLNTMRKIS